MGLTEPVWWRYVVQYIEAHKAQGGEPSQIKRNSNVCLCVCVTGVWVLLCIILGPGRRDDKQSQKMANKKYVSLLEDTHTHSRTFGLL